MKLEYDAEGDQWARDGDCSKCRRQKYCSKSCKAYKVRQDRIFRKIFAEAVAKHLFGKEGGAEDDGNKNQIY